VTRIFAFGANISTSGLKDDVEKPTFAAFVARASREYAQISATLWAICRHNGGTRPSSISSQGFILSMSGRALVFRTRRRASAVRPWIALSIA
jgi:hypothetical protein